MIVLLSLRRLVRGLLRFVRLILHAAKQLLSVFRQLGLRRRKPPSIAARSTFGFRRQTKPESVRHEVIRFKALLPGAGCRHIAEVFNRAYAAKRKESVSKSYVSYTVRKHQYEILVLRRELKHRIPRPMPNNRLWTINLSGKGDVFGDSHHILGIVDHGSRKLLELAAPDNKNAWTLLGYLFLAIGRYGKPQIVRTDNEAVFRSGVFRLGCSLAGIRQQFTTPGCPWMNGKMERIFGTLKMHLDKLKIDGRETLAGLLGEFAFWYNAVRPHQHLDGRTPNEVWTGGDHYAKAPKSAEYFVGWGGLLRGIYLRY